MCVYLFKSHWQAGSVGKGACCQARGAEHEMGAATIKGMGDEYDRGSRSDEMCGWGVFVEASRGEDHWAESSTQRQLGRHEGANTTAEILARTKPKQEEPGPVYLENKLGDSDREMST